MNVVFLGGADFDNPPTLGTTDRTRYFKVTTLEEVQRPELHKWIEEASRTPGSRNWRSSPRFVRGQERRLGTAHRVRILRGRRLVL